MRKPHLIRPGYFAWIAMPLAIYGLYLTLGWPHLLWSYTWTPRGPDSHAEFSQRYYTRCTYVGPYGPIIIRPADGSCGLVRFAKSPGS